MLADGRWDLIGPIHTLIPDIYSASTVALIQSVILYIRLHAVLIKTKQRE